jgi:hypothetical protein
MLIDIPISGDGNVIKKEPRKLQNIKTLQQKYSASGKKKSDTSNERGNWNHLKITHKQHNGKVRNQGTVENNHIKHCTHTSESTNVKTQNI